MKKVLSITVLLLMVATPAHAGEWFSWVTLLMIADLGQTLDIANNCQLQYGDFNNDGSLDSMRNITESNKHLGPCPTRTHVKQYFGWMYALISTVVWVSPSELSYTIQGSAITIELYYVARNYYVGVGIGF
jgi:hypothetical protein